MDVETGAGETPSAVDGISAEAVLEEWVVEDGWWTSKSLERHYYELVLADGRDVTVFRSRRSGHWYWQRA